MSDDPTDERTDDADHAGTDADESAGIDADSTAGADDPTPATTDDATETDTDDTTTMTETDTESEAETTSEESTGERVRRALNYLLLAGLAIFALVAAVGFYTATSSAISTWVTAEYRPLVRAAFNLVVLLVVGAAIVRQVRRIS